MKKSALLAVSALSLGVVGLASFAPMVSAEDLATTTATVKLKVQDGGGLVPPTTEPNQKGEGITTGVIDLGSIKPNDESQEVAATVSAYNNKNGYSVTMKANGDGALTNGSAKIPTGANIGTGTSAWGVKADDAGGATADKNFVAVPKDQEAGKLVINQENKGKATTGLTFKASTNTEAASGNYTATITYTSGAYVAPETGK